MQTIQPENNPIISFYCFIFDFNFKVGRMNEEEASAAETKRNTLNATRQKPNTLSSTSSSFT